MVLKVYNTCTAPLEIHKEFPLGVWIRDCFLKAFYHREHRGRGEKPLENLCGLRVLRGLCSFLAHNMYLRNSLSAVYYQ
jgi:hypothetical protein